MKRSICFLIFVLFTAALISCSKKKLGQWDDNIHLSKRQVEFKSSQDSATIYTVGNSWWLNDIALDNNLIDLQQIDHTSQNFIVEEPEYTVQRINGRTIKIKMNANSTNAERMLFIGLQAGDYFDAIRITQKAN